MTLRRTLIALGVLLLPGCGLVVDEPPAESPRELAPAVTPEAPAARDIGDVRVPALSQDGYERRAERLTVRVRNLSCDGVATGSGFAVSTHELVTNRHVVAGAERLEINTWDGRTLEVSAADVGALGDVAFVTTVEPLPLVADFGETVAPGSRVAAVGYPLGGPFKITRGVVVDRVSGTPFDVPGSILRIRAEVVPGNSGGPLLDRAGRVVGVVYALEVATGLGLAIPNDTLEELLAAAGTTDIPACGVE
ncbi:MAG: trypsin-like peptidase domain-containing protein [Thermoleophilia bacterium]